MIMMMNVAILNCLLFPDVVIDVLAVSHSLDAKIISSISRKVLLDPRGSIRGQITVLSNKLHMTSASEGLSLVVVQTGIYLPLPSTVQSTPATLA